MKQGANKPLEEDESAFLDTVAREQQAQLQRKQTEDARELESFQVCSVGTASLLRCTY